MMPPRQLWLFEFGCWAAFAAAVVHLVAHLVESGQLSPHAASSLQLLDPDYVFQVPGLRQPTYQGVVDGLSLALPVLLATIGAAGLSIARHGQGEPRLVRSVAGFFAIGTTAVLVLSGVLFFSLLTFVLALPALCFALASVREE